MTKVEPLINSWIGGTEGKDFDMKLKKMMVTMAAVAGTMCLFAGCAGASGKDYEEPVVKLCEAKENADLEEMLSLFGGMSEFIGGQVTQDVMDDVKAVYEGRVGDNLKITYKVDEATQLEEEDLEETAGMYAMFDEDAEITDGYDLEITETAKGSEGTYTNEMELSVGCIDGEWYIINFDSNMLNMQED